MSVPTSAELNAGNRDVHVTFSMKTASVPKVPIDALFREQATSLLELARPGR